MNKNRGRFWHRTAQAKFEKPRKKYLKRNVLLTIEEGEPIYNHWIPLEVLKRKKSYKIKMMHLK